MSKLRFLKNRLIIGCILLCVSLGVYHYNKYFRENANKTIGIIVDYDTSLQDDGSIKKFPIYEYTSISGGVYRYKVVASSDEIIIGTSDIIYYDKNNPKRALVGESNFDFFSFIPLAIGLIFLITHIFILIKRSYKKNKFMNLRASEKKIIIPYNRIYIDKFNGENTEYYKVLTQWDDVKNNKVYLFKSEKLKNNPASEIKGKDIVLYLAHSNYKKYVVDISFLNEFNG